MITSKQRAFLRSKANTLEACMQIGKECINDNSLTTIKQLLEARELIKIKVLQTCELTAREVQKEICFSTKAEPVQAIGNIIVIFRRSSRDDIKHIEF